MIYKNKGFNAPTMMVLSYYLFLRRNGDDLGFYYLSFWTKHNKKRFSNENSSKMKTWKVEYFYFYDVPRIRFQFNLKPCKCIPFFEVTHFNTSVAYYPLASPFLAIVFTRLDLHIYKYTLSD